MTLDSTSSPQEWTALICQTAGGSFSIGECPEPVNDSLLVAAAQSGDMLAFTELRNRHAPRMRRLLYRITKDWDDADDALQECFFSVFVNLDRFENKSKFSTWLTTVAVNSGVTILRKRRWHREISIDGRSDERRPNNEWETKNRAEDPETYTARREREELLRQAVLRLPSVYRSVFELRATQEYSMKEISERLAISLPAVKSRLLRARKALKISLGERHDFLTSKASLKQKN